MPPPTPRQQSPDLCATRSRKIRHYVLSWVACTAKLVRRGVATTPPLTPHWCGRSSHELSGIEALLPSASDSGRRSRLDCIRGLLCRGHGQRSRRFHRRKRSIGSLAPILLRAGGGLPIQDVG